MASTSVRTGNPSGARVKQPPSSLSATTAAAGGGGGGLVDDLDELRKNFAFRMSKKVAELTQV
jgi:hypothetical protein